MKKVNTIQEILLHTESCFSRRELCEGDIFANTNKYASFCEKLEAACWNGILCEWLPGTIETGRKGQRLFIWKIDVANRFLRLQLSESPADVDDYYSLDPYLFLHSRNLN